MTVSNPLDTLPDLADGLDALYKERRALDGRIQHLKDVMLSWSLANSNIEEDGEWRGAIIKGERASFAAYKRLEDSGPPIQWKWRLEYLRGPHDDSND